MTTPLPPELATLAHDLTTPLHATPARRRAIREELLSHLLSTYEEELSRHPDDALHSTLRRLGHPATLRPQLQSSVPLIERLFFQSLSKETLMSRWIWLPALLALFFGPGMILPALARHKQQGVPWSVIAPYLAIGLAITLAGLVTILYGVVRRLRRTA